MMYKAWAIKLSMKKQLKQNRRMESVLFLCPVFFIDVYLSLSNIKIYPRYKADTKLQLKLYSGKLI